MQHCLLFCSCVFFSFFFNSLNTTQKLLTSKLLYQKRKTNKINFPFQTIIPKLIPKIHKPKPHLFLVFFFTLENIKKPLKFLLPSKYTKKKKNLYLNPAFSRKKIYSHFLIFLLIPPILVSSLFSFLFLGFL